MSSRNYPRPKSRNVPTKVRRRQSDAKWRASVQSCYESLKLIIPESRRSNKRKLSKALILQETENHLAYLEDVLTTLLEEKEKRIDHDIIVPSKSSPQTFQEIRDEFALKVQPPLQHLPKSKKMKNGKRQRGCSSSNNGQRTTEPDKIICTLFQGDQYYYLSGKTFCLQKATPPKSERIRRYYETKHLFGSSTQDSPKTTTPAPVGRSYFGSNTNQPPYSPGLLNLSSSPKAEASVLLKLNPQLSDSKERRAEVFLPQVTPSKNDSDIENVNPCSPWHSAALSSIQHHPAFLTPSKVTRKLPFDLGSPSPLSVESASVRSAPGSPCWGSPARAIPKEPLFELQLGDNFMEVPSTPVLTYGIDDEFDNAKHLLCTESMDTMELGDEADWLEEQNLQRMRRPSAVGNLQLTPCPDHKAETTCCPSEQELQNRPKKATVKRGILFSDPSENDVTPAKLGRIVDKPKCCKQLEGLYERDEQLPHEVPIDVISVQQNTNECNHFDGYFYFYRQISGALECHVSEELRQSPTFAEAISQMWNDMNEDQKTTLVTIAALENSGPSPSSSTELSEDLSDIAVVPISGADLIQDLQVVPSGMKQAVTCTEGQKGNDLEGICQISL